jgi:hypothetical protein
LSHSKEKNSSESLEIQTKKNIIKVLHYIFCQEYKLGCLHQRR